MNFNVKEQAQLVHEIDITKKGPVCSIDNSSHVPLGGFHRVAYYLQLQHPRYGNQWVYTAFDAFTNDAVKIGIPKDNGKNWVFSQPISNLVVKSSSTSLVNQCSTNGSMLFSAYNYSDARTVFACKGNYGTMQITSNNTTVWAYNHFKSTRCDIGIGTNVDAAGRSQNDWTFAENGNEYTVKHMKVYVIYNEVGHINEVTSTVMKVNLRGVAHGDALRYNSQTTTWGAASVPYKYVLKNDTLPNFIIVLSGQSNSQGWNTTSDPSDWRDTPHNRIFGYNPETKMWETANLGTQSLGSSWHRMPGWQSLAFHFARRLVEAYSDIRPGIVNVGIGGQAICRWAKYAPNENWYEFNCKRALSSGVVQGDIFDLHEHHINDALGLCEDGCKVDVICWHQGESDCDELGGNAVYYKDSLERVVKQYRGLHWCAADTPFIVGETSSSSRNVQIHEVATTNANIRCVRTMDISRQKEDPIHFDSEGQRDLGTRYFRAYRSIFEH